VSVDRLAGEPEQALSNAGTPSRIPMGGSEATGQRVDALRERRRGRLHVLLGATPGVGKTFATLDEGLQLAEEGADVLVGVVETHDRPDLVARIGGSRSSRGARSPIGVCRLRRWTWTCC
jgi:Osmosensitive K+ channel His kinase sensor domain